MKSFAQYVHIVKNVTVNGVVNVMDNVVLPGAEKLDAQVAIAVPVVQMKGASVLASGAVLAHRLAQFTAGKAMELAVKAAKNNGVSVCPLMLEGK